MGTCQRKTICRLCGSGRLEMVFPLAPTPPANAFRSADQLRAPQPTYPLELMHCGACSHLQLGHVVDPVSLFSNYVYVSGTSPSFVAHFDAYANTAWKIANGAVNDLVVDIGSNDGTLLKSFRKLDAKIQGVDPAKRIAEEASQSGIPTIADFFNYEIAAQIIQENGAAKIITANNVCAHIDDLRSVIDAVVHLLRADGLFVFEVSYLLDVLENTLFDTIYHEHLDYHAVTPLVAFLEGAGLTLFHAEKVPSHGGSIRLFAAPLAAKRKPTKALKDLMAVETSLDISNPALYRKFADQITQAGVKLLETIRESQAKGRTLAGYGAPAKATTLMYQFGLTQNDLAYIVDDSSWKQGLYSPGLNIPIVSSDHLADHPVDDLIILAWNFSKPIIDNNRKFLTDGRRFIVPLPNLEVVTENDS